MKFEFLLLSLHDENYEEEQDCLTSNERVVLKGCAWMLRKSGRDFINKIGVMTGS
jgi:3-methyladenine DNA glycosylase AlkD